VSRQVIWEAQAIDQAAGFLHDDPDGVREMLDAVARLADELSDAIDGVSAMQPDSDISNIYTSKSWLGGWGSNPRPADYEEYGPTHRAR
jgi:hypothetical protein